jgi:hypothetical protein
MAWETVSVLALALATALAWVSARVSALAWASEPGWAWVSVAPG